MIEPADYQYDVFISFSPADDTWVWDVLLPRLEGAGLRVCIGERDFTLGVLARRELIEPVDGGYRFQVELIRRWFAAK